MLKAMVGSWLENTRNLVFPGNSRCIPPPSSNPWNPELCEFLNLRNPKKLEFRPLWNLHRIRVQALLNEAIRAAGSAS